MRLPKPLLFASLFLFLFSFLISASTRIVGIEKVSNGQFLVIADAVADYTVFELTEPQRLVIDFNNSIAEKQLVECGGDILAVRCAQHQTEPTNVARLVFDLSAPLAYEVREHERGVLVDFSLPTAEAPEIIEVPEELTDVELADSMVELPKVKLAQLDVETVEVEEAGDEDLEIDVTEDEYIGEPISIDFKEISVVELLRFLAEIGEKNIVIHPDVKGLVTLKLTEVPWDAVFDIVLRDQDLGKEVSGDIIRVAQMDKLIKEKESEAKLKQQRALAVDLQTELITLNYAKAVDVKAIFDKFKSKKEGAEIITDKRTNTVIIRDIPDYISKMKQLIATIDRATEQVSIDARIVETTADWSRNLGIDWRVGYTASPKYGNTTRYEFPYTYDTTFFTNLNDDPAAPAFSHNFAINMGNLTGSTQVSAVIDAMETVGGAKQIAAPKVVVQNNESAMLDQGTEITLSIPGAGGGTGATATIEAFTRIEVTPSITPDRKISLDIIVEKSLPIDSDASDGSISVERKRVESTVIVEDGMTAVIGGLFSAQETNTDSKIPLLGDIPILGYLFGYERKIKQNTELLIFITPQIKEDM